MRGKEHHRHLLNVMSTRRGYNAALPDTNIIGQKRDKATFCSPILTLSRLANSRPMTFKILPFNTEIFILLLPKPAPEY